MAIVGQKAQEGLDVAVAAFARVTQVAPAHEQADPAHIRLLGAQAVVQVANPLPYLLKQTGRGQHRPAGFGRSVITVHAHSIGRKCRPLQAFPQTGVWCYSAGPGVIQQNDAYNKLDIEDKCEAQ